MNHFRKVSLLLLFFLLGACSSKVSSENVATTQKRHARNTLPLVVIDPGHGGLDLGAHTEICEEKDICLRLAHHVRLQLEKKGYRIVMTRTRDEHIPLKKRAEIANESRCQALVSLHFNSARNKKAKGIEIYYSGKAEPWRAKRSKQLAQNLLAKVLVETGAESRGIKQGNFCVIRDTSMPSVLIEGGFITNDEEQKKIIDDRYLINMAHAIAEGLDQYFKT